MENPAKVYVESQKLLDEILANFKADATISWINSGMKPQKAVSE